MVYRAINGLIRHAIGADLITNDDIFVVRNQLMDILKLTDWNDKEWILFVMKSAEFLNRYLKMPEYLREINKEKKHLQDL